MKRLIKRIQKRSKPSSSSGTQEPSPTPEEPALGTPGDTVETQETSTSALPSEAGAEVLNQQLEEVPNSSKVYGQISDWLEQGLLVQQ